MDSRRPRWLFPFTASLALLVCVWSLASFGGGHSSSLSSTALTSLDVNTTRDQCRSVVERQRDVLYETFAQVLDGVRNVALISMPDHVNKGDSVIFVAEMELLASLGINVQYSCGVKDCSMSAIQDTIDQFRQDHFAIAFHGGGNFGDLYGREHSLKLDVMRKFPDVRMHVFPQSIKFRDAGSKIEETRAALAGLTHPLNSLAVRDLTSFTFAKKHFDLPRLRIDMTPDIVFYLGPRPDLRRLLAPKSPKTTTTDLLFFRRKDGEGSAWSWAGDGGASSSDFPQTIVKRLSDAAAKATGRSKAAAALLTSKHGDWIDWDLTAEELKGGHIQFRAFRRFMMGATWLSSADFIVLDRLHGHIVSLLLGIPHVLIDNNIGKLGDYYSTWTHDCPLGQLVVNDGSGGDEGMAKRVEAAYAAWVAGGKISG